MYIEKLLLRKFCRHLRYAWFVDPPPLLLLLLHLVTIIFTMAKLLELVAVQLQLQNGVSDGGSLCEIHFADRR